MAGVQLARNEPIGRELYAALRERILTGALKPGDAISEIQVADELGVSRTPVREVFRRLADEGLLRILPQVGTFISPIQLRAVYDSQFVRETLECRTVRIASERQTRQDADRLEDFLTLQTRAIRDGNLAGFFRADDDMHTYLIGMAGRPAIWSLIQGVKAQLDRVRFLSLESGEWLDRIMEQHRAIIAAVLAGDADKAEAAMRIHLQSVFQTIERLAETQKAFFEGERDLVRP
ncbi:GntR family transcriptional regulator [Phyllobacterium brassicacearum]|uniref:GntR family transcriptional regulator n=1 Tax=Phyllobacterium brassicacearum TaxID=314235 RepID=A0A2P7BH80_9HYPH|nr:GntR family transcriptional regulator [Phyllobacterium brassicacearum]